MIIQEQIKFYERFKPYYKGNMLVLGNQESEVGNPKDFFNVESYKTLDLDNGDYRLDLTKEIDDFAESFDVVFNIGTLEHIWDVQAAYSNAARLVKVGGHFISIGPVAGWENHGIHVTSSWAILSFFRKNGFEIIDDFLVDRKQTIVNFGKKDKGRDIELWFAAKKISSVETFLPPSHVYDNNVPVRQ